MTLEILMATMNRTDIGFIHPSITELVQKDNNVSLLIINQCTKIEPSLFIENKRLRIYSVKQSGLSNSRNMALELAKGDICILLDDDCEIEEGASNKILSFHKKYDAPIITYKLKDSLTGKPFKRYLPFIFTNNLITIGRISSCEISFKRTKILQSGIKFNPLFGLGSKYNLGGEENIFLSECYHNKLKIIFVPAVIIATPLGTERNILYPEHGLYTGKIISEIFYNERILGIIYLTISCFIKAHKINNIRNLFYYLHNTYSSYWNSLKKT